MQSHATDGAMPAEKPDFRAILAISAIGALGSLIVTGCLVGVRNDLYFLPILGAVGWKLRQGRRRRADDDN